MTTPQTDKKTPAKTESLDQVRLWFPALKTVTAAVYEGPPTRTGSGCIGGGFPLPR